MGHLFDIWWVKKQCINSTLSMKDSRTFLPHYPFVNFSILYEYIIHALCLIQCICLKKKEVKEEQCDKYISRNPDNKL